jgi:hypothetical protein
MGEQIMCILCNRPAADLFCADAQACEAYVLSLPEDQRVPGSGMGALLENATLDRDSDDSCPGCDSDDCACCAYWNDPDNNPAPHASGLY